MWRPMVAILALPTVVGTVALPLGVARSAGAAVEDLVASLRIDCSVLGIEGQDALEARARAEIVLAPRPAGEIAIQCADHAALVAWRGPDGSRRERRVALDDDPKIAVDGLLGAVHALRFDQARRSAVAVAVARPRVTESTTQRSVAVVGPRAATSTPQQSVVAAALPPSQDPYRWAAIVGTDGELWQGAIRGAVGAAFGARIVTPTERWSLGLLGGLAWGWSMPDGIRAQTLRLMLSGTYAPTNHLEIGLGAEVKALLTSVTSSDGSAERHAITEGAVATVRYRLALGSFELSVGPQVEAFAQPIVVRVAGQELFRIPTLVAGFSVYGQHTFGR